MPAPLGLFLFTDILTPICFTNWHKLLSFIFHLGGVFHERFYVTYWIWLYFFNRNFFFFAVKLWYWWSFPDWVLGIWVSTLCTFFILGIYFTKVAALDYANHDICLNISVFYYILNLGNSLWAIKWKNHRTQHSLFSINHLEMRMANIRLY